jgi:hypothetical protein
MVDCTERVDGWVASATRACRTPGSRSGAGGTATHHRRAVPET